MSQPRNIYKSAKEKSYVTYPLPSSPTLPPLATSQHLNSTQHAIELKLFTRTIHEEAFSSPSSPIAQKSLDEFGSPRRKYIEDAVSHLNSTQHATERPVPPPPPAPSPTPTPWDRGQGSVTRPEGETHSEVWGKLCLLWRD